MSGGLPATLANLLAPLDAQTFLAQHWDVRHALAQAVEPSRHTHLLSVQDVERLVQGELLRWQHDLELTDARQRPDARRLERLRRADGTVDAEAVFTAFSDGTTLVFNDLTRHAPAVAELCRTLAGELHLRVQANGYLSPPDAQGFPVHFDTHDVLILQCSGRKRWRIHRRVCESPRDSDGRDLAPDEAGPVLHEFDLGPGDTLYLPRGVAHQADCTSAASEPSLHLSLGIHPLTWAEVLHHAIEQAAAHDPALRRSLPPCWLDQREALATGLAPILAGLRVDAGAAIDAAATSILARLRQTSGSRFADVARCRDLAPDQHLVPRQPGACVVQDAGGQVVLRFPGGFLRGPARIAPALRLVVERGPAGLRIDELPDLDDAGRLVLARRLILGGALRCSDG